MNEEKELQENSEITADSADVNVNADESAGADIPNLSEDEFEKLKADLAEQKDKYLRLMAEFDNYRRRTSKERLELIQTAGKEIIASLLEVLDDCDRAEIQMQTLEDVGAVKNGTLLIFNKLRNNFQSRGLKMMESLHLDFDVEKHDAVTEIPAPTEEMKGKVVDEIQKGYYLNDKIIRHAKVVVGK